MLKFRVKWPLQITDILFSISVVYIKEELKDAALDVKIEPAVNSPLVKEEFVSVPAMNMLPNEGDDSTKDLIVEKQNQIIIANYSMIKSVMKEEPLQDDLVSE